MFTNPSNTRNATFSDGFRANATDNLEPRRTPVYAMTLSRILGHDEPSSAIAIFFGLAAYAGAMAAGVAMLGLLTAFMHEQWQFG